MSDKRLKLGHLSSNCASIQAKDLWITFKFANESILSEIYDHQILIEMTSLENIILSNGVFSPKIGVAPCKVSPKALIRRVQLFKLSRRRLFTTVCIWRTAKGELRKVFTVGQNSKEILQKQLHEKTNYHCFIERKFVLKSSVLTLPNV
uniref:Uncharacterized protein n=1 Tax=Glossina pallidipes TaxID=7398 RepID=A0A1B0A894_GLOPL